MRETLPLPLLILLLSLTFPPASSLPPEAAAEPDPASWLVLKLNEGKEGIVGSQLADGEVLGDLGLNQLNRKTDTILDTIEAITVGETSNHEVVHDISEN